MKQIIVHTQKQFDKIKDNFDGEIIIRDTSEWLKINMDFNNAYIYIGSNATIKYVYDNATIKSVSDNATIKYVYDNATIKSVSDNATIKSVSDNAIIEYVYDNATIKSVYGNATIKYVYGNATIKSVYGNATILLLSGLACICFLYSANKIVAKGINMIRQIGTKKIDLTFSKSVNFIQVKETIKETPTFNLYSKLYPVELKGNKVIMYKAVRKVNKKYLSNYNSSFEYKIGEVKTEECSEDTSNSCSKGIHISHLNWAILFGKNWDNLAILELEVNKKDIVVSSDCDGKVRCSKVKILRELDKSEY